MTSKQEEFTHDIFISYRHKDNKPLGGIGEGWVSEFVNYLSSELETIIKGKVSIYFDKNPHDGLKEHHSVDNSLNNHLNSVIFIPILSQTYCDEECYAWKNEFLPFLRLSKNDSIGPSIRLPDGNVTGRILPICIHDLEQSDLRKIESELNGKLRAINFVFKAPGVNRPLRAFEEDPLKNANHIIYRDQINKVANAIREIITSMRSSDKTPENSKAKKINGLDSLLSTANFVKSIAVMPLVFKSQNSNDEFLAQGFSEDLFTSLKQIKALRSSIHGLSSANDSIKHVGSAPASTMVLTGNMTATDNSLGINLQLVQAKTGKQMWHGDYECERDKVFKLRPMIITQICESLSINLKDNERKSIQHQAEASPAAIEYFWKGRFHWRKRGNDLLTSLECFQKSVDLAPGFADGHAGIANACVLLGYYGLIPFQESLDKCKESALKALKIDPTVVDAYYALAYASLCYELAWPDSELNFEKVFSINPNSITASNKFKNYFTQIICNFEIAETEVEPGGTVPYFLPAYSLMHKGKFEEGLKVAKIAISKNEGSFMAHRAAGLCYLELGYRNEAIETLNTAAQLSNRHPWILFDLMGAYAIMGNNEEALSIMEESMDHINNLPARINDFYFNTA